MTFTNGFTSITWSDDYFEAFENECIEELKNEYPDTWQNFYVKNRVNPDYVDQCYWEAENLP